MTEFVSESDARVRIDIPDEIVPDHRLHGKHGQVITVIEDDAGEETGDVRDSTIYRIRMDDGETVNLR